MNQCVDEALSWYSRGPKARKKLMSNCALSDFSWETSSALEQAAIYREVINEAPSSTACKQAVDQLLEGMSRNPHEILGLHETVINGKKADVIRAYFPDDTRNLSVSMKMKPEATSKKRPQQQARRQQIEMKAVNEKGLYEAILPEGHNGSYYFEFKGEDGQVTRVQDPYRFAPTVSDEQRWLFAEGKLDDVAGLIGANICHQDGVEGYRFCTWAPNAKRVSVIHEGNSWDGRRHQMRQLGGGLWEIFVPDVQAGTSYKYEIVGANGKLLRRSDPAARSTEFRPSNASKVPAISKHTWSDEEWMKVRAVTDAKTQPVSVYEVHLGSWRRKADGSFMSYHEIAEQLIPYLKDNNFTHVELMPITEHPFDGSWGYQCTGYFAPTSRFGDPDGLKYLINQCHQAGIGAIIDWVPGHFPKDEYALSGFDGTNLFDHQDPRRGEHKDWGTRIFNYDRKEVRSFLHGSALHMLEEYHFDGIRVDGVSSMLYRDYSRNHGEWVPNEDGGNEDFGAVNFLRDLNQRIKDKFPGVMRIAEESTSWPGVTSAMTPGETKEKNLGIDNKWNMGWMNDTRAGLKNRTNMSSSMICSSIHSIGRTMNASSARCPTMKSCTEKNHFLRKCRAMTGKNMNLRLLYAHMWSYPGHKLRLRVVSPRKNLSGMKMLSSIGRHQQPTYSRCSASRCRFESTVFKPIKFAPFSV